MGLESANYGWLKWGVGIALVLSVVAVALGVLAYSSQPSLVPSDLSARAANTNCFIEQGGNKVVAGSGCEYEFQSGAVLDIQAGTTVGGDAGLDLNGVGAIIWDADADTTSDATADDVVENTLGAATGTWEILVGNLAVGNGTPTLTLDGEDFYVEGTLEADGIANFAAAVNALADVDVGTWVNFSAQTSLTIAAGGIITPTGTYQLIDSAGVVAGSTTTPISTAGRETGDVVIIRNANAADAITIDGVGGTVECKADVALGASDTLTLIYNGTAWNCLATYDNS